MPDIPHIAFPPRLTGTRLLTYEQDSPEEIKQCVLNLLRTPRGWSDEDDLQEMGLAGQKFRRGGPDLVEISAQIDKYEPRAEATVINDRPELLNDALAEIGVRLTTTPGGT